MGQFNSKLNMKLRKMESKYELFIKAYDNKKIVYNSREQEDTQNIQEKEIYKL